LRPLRHEVELALAEALLVFTAIDSETDALPVGEVRQQWSAEALDRKDREIANAEIRYREVAMEGAARLLQLIEIPS
jgi:hypothetical protein